MPGPSVRHGSPDWSSWSGRCDVVTYTSCYTTCWEVQVNLSLFSHIYLTFAQLSVIKFPCCLVTAFRVEIFGVIA